MNQRITQVFLAAVTVLLAVHLLRGPMPGARAGDSTEAPAVLRARMFELVNAEGKTRATLKIEPEGEAVFRLFDAKGTIRVKVGAAENGSGIVLLNDETEPGVQILSKNTGTSVALSEKGKEKRVLRP